MQKGHRSWGECGVILVEAAVVLAALAIFLLLLVDFSFALSERITFTEAARHGGRALSGHSIQEKVCIPASSVNLSCDDFGSNGSDLTRAVEAACSFLVASGIDPSEVNVSVAVSALNLEENAESSPPATASSFVQVRADRISGRASLFRALGLSAQTASFPLLLLSNPSNYWSRCNGN